MREVINYLGNSQNLTKIRHRFSSRAMVQNRALFRLRCQVLNVFSHSVPNTLSGHLNFRAFHDVSKAHALLKCANKHVIHVCCLNLFDDVLPHEEIAR